MSRTKYTPEMKAFMEATVPGHLDEEVAELFNERFPDFGGMSREQARSYRKNHGLKSGIPRPRGQVTVMTPEQQAYFAEINEGRTRQEVQALLIERFGTAPTLQQIRAYRKNHKMPCGVNTRFRPGQEGLTKGKRMGIYHNDAVKACYFKKGQKPWNTVPVGTEVVATVGYIKVKVAEPDVWRWKHRMIWEEANGPVPEGMCLLFLNGDKTDVRLENLACVQTGTNTYLSNQGLNVGDPEIAKTAIAIRELQRKIKDRRPKRKRKEKQND